MIFKNNIKIGLSIIANKVFSIYRRISRKEQIVYGPIDVNKNNILLTIEVFGIGDLFLSFYAHKKIKERFNDAKLILITYPEYQETCSNFKIYDEIIPINAFWCKGSRYKADLPYLIKKVRQIKEKYKIDIAFDLRGDLRNLVFLRLLKPKVLASYDYVGNSAIVDFKIINSHQNKHKVTQDLEFIKYLFGIKVTGNKRKCILDRKGNVLIKVHTGSAKKNKELDKYETYILLKKILRKKCKIEYISDHNNEKDKYLKNMFNNIAIVKPKDIKTLINIIKEADIFIGCDSAPGHIAAHYEINTISIFFEEDPIIWAPYKTNSKVVFKTNQKYIEQIDGFIDEIIEYGE